ncbi:MAG: long-chain fatty acid--CoA ligase [Gemmatimonadales bacterium]|nr:long-chain fatty acid--CoA ligase [Gemmatimonadales bacterium]
MTAPNPGQGPTTLTQLYFDAVERFAARPVALRAKRKGAWTDLGYDQLADRVKAISLGLRSLGIRPGDRVAILSENRPEWALADYACLTARAADVPIYPTLTPKQIRYLLDDSGARVVFVSTAAQLAKLAEIRSELTGVEQIVAFDTELAGDGVMALSALEDRGRAVAGQHPDWRRDALAVTPDDLATIIYTSGTTGEPKGVMLTHGNIASNVRAGCAVLGVSGSDSCLSLLPLSHIFERMVGHYSMFHQGVVINYAESIDTVPRDLAEVRPTVVAAVPRLYEKIYAKAVESAVHGSPITRTVFFWAKGVGDRWADLTLAGKSIPLGLALERAVADRLVFSKLRRRVGGRLRYFISGGAPLSAEIARFFYAAGLPILEGYGLTETSPVITVNSLDHLRFGTVGRPVPGVEVMIAADGEILTRGPHVMRGYFNKPAETAEAIDPDGWFHTGDIGELDADGFLKITDRKKDLIATAGGKKIAPQPIEGMLRQNKFIANAVLLGDRRKFPIALIAPNFPELEAWAKGAGLSWNTRQALIDQEPVRALIESEAKKHLRDLARFEVPKRFLLVAREFSIESGELTPKLSVKRRVVEAHYREQIEALYQEAEANGQPDA